MDEVIVFEVDAEIVENGVNEFEAELDSLADIEIVSDGVEVGDEDVDVAIDTDEIGEALLYRLEEPELEPELEYDAEFDNIDE